MSNDELTKHAIRTSADMLALTEKVDEIKRVQGEHTERFEGIDQRFDSIESTLKAHVAVSHDHFRNTDANLLEVRDMLGQLIARGT